jgi:peptidoglycan/LPS O-acetylase OafA/YrhL
MTVAESPLAPEEPVKGTRQRLDHIDAMRPVKQAGVVSTHTLLAFAPVGTGLSVGAALMLLHVTREAFLFVSACMLTYSFRDQLRVQLGTFWRRRFMLVGVPYLCWTVIYFFLTLHSKHLHSFAAGAEHLGYLAITGYYQLYYLVVLLEFYAVFPLLLLLLRKTVGRHGLLLVVSGVLQLLLVSLMHWELLPDWMRGFWASREVTSYGFYLIGGMVIALHLDEVHQWLCSHVRLVVGSTVVFAVMAEVWYFFASDRAYSWLGSNSDPFQPIVIPFNIGAIASIYLVGVFLVNRRRSPRTRAAVQAGSDDSYGVYLAQMVFITALGWVGWISLNRFVPWPLLCAITVVIVFLACMGLTELLARTPLSKWLTGRTRVPRRAEHTSTPESVSQRIPVEAGVS